MPIEEVMGGGASSIGAPEGVEDVRLSVDAQSVLDAIPGVVVLINATGEVVWINDAMTELTGFTPDELVGSSMLDHLDLEWNALVLESISYALENPGMRLPTMLRFHTARDTTMVMEATANNQLDNPAIQALVVHLRPSDERQLLDQILESFAEGDDLAATFRRVHDVGRSETMQAESALVLARPDPDHGGVLGSNAAVQALCTATGMTLPWAQAALTSSPVLLATLDELPELLRDAALAAGFAACWAYPINRARTGVVDGVLVFWRREPGLPEPSSVMMAERLVRLSELVLERVEHSRELRDAAQHDPLTGLVNRSHFFDIVEGHLADKRSLGVLYLDLDGFKPINDQWGHGHGDEVLVAIAERLRASVRPGDTVARLGGDEFCVACPDAGADELVRLADRLLAVVRAPITVRRSVLRVGTSIGLATCEGGAAAADELVAAADAALIAAKATAKGTWRLSP